MDLRDALRSGDDAALQRAIGVAVGAKAFAHGGHKDMQAIAKGNNRSMIRIGG